MPHSNSLLEHEIEDIKATSELRHRINELDELRSQNSLLRAVLNNFPGGISLFDKNLKMILCNNELKDLLQYPESLFAFGQPSLEQIFRFNAMRGEYGPGDVEEHVANKMKLVDLKCPHVYERLRPNGTMVEVRGVPIEGGGFLTSYIDITNQRPVIQQTGHTELLDRLTGLPKLDNIKKRINELLSDMPKGDVASLHCLDLDNFSKLNAKYGKATGDLVLKEVASRLSGAVRLNDCLARIGGDRFLVLQTNVTRPSEVAKLAHRLLDVIKKPICFGEKIIHVRSSVGLALAPRDGQSADHLIAKATADVVDVKNRNRGPKERTKH